MESINSKLRVTLIESTLLEDQQSKFKSMIKNLKDWIKKIKERFQKMTVKLATFVKTKLSKVKQAPKNPKMTEKQAKKIIDAEATLKEVSKKYNEINKKTENSFLNLNASDFIDFDKLDAKLERNNSNVDYDLIDEVRKPFRDYEEEIDDLIDHLRKNAKSSSVSESSDGYRDAAEYRMAQTAFSKSDNVFKIYLQISNFIVKDIGRTLGSIKRSIKMCEQAILDRERAERDREAERVGRANSNKMVEVGKNPKKIPFSKKFKIYSVVIGGTLYRVSKQFTILFEVTSIAITAGIIKTIVKTANAVGKGINKVKDIKNNKKTASA